MGRNGAGKSTLLRHAAGLHGADARARSAPPDASRCCCRTPATTSCTTASATRPPRPRCAPSASSGLADRHPRDLSGGERQRLALAVVLGDGEHEAAAVCLDEPTRGMDRAAKGELADRLPRVAGARQRGRRRHARRRVRRGGGRPRRAARRRARHRRRRRPRAARRRLVLRDRDRRGSAAPAARSRPSRAPSCCADRHVEVAMTWPARLVRDPRRRARRPASPGRSARGRRRGCSRSSPRWPRSRRSGGSRSPPLPNVKPTTDIVAHRGLRARRRARVRGRRRRRAGVERRVRAGPVDAVADGRVGLGRR